MVVVSFSVGSLSASVRAEGSSEFVNAARSVPRCTISGRVLESAGGLGLTIAIHAAACSGRVLSVDGEVAIASDVSADSGADIAGSTWVLPLDPDDPFDRARRAAGAVVALDPIALEVGPVRGFFHRAAAWLRSSLRDATSDLDPRAGALMRGLTIGDTSGLDQPTTDRLRAAGLSHLVAVSGSNVAIVVGAVTVATRRSPLRRRVALAAGALGLFVVVVGPDPSVLRAAAMGSIGLWALSLGRRVEPLHGLAVALIVVIAARPAIVSSLGLHLSAAATAGIVLWAGAIAGKLRRLPAPVALVLGVTLAAQLAVAPILIAGFGEISIVAPLTNLLAAPAVPVATMAGLAASVIGLVSGGAADLLAALAAPFVRWVLLIGDLGGAHPHARLQLPSWTALVVAVPVLACALGSLSKAFEPALGSGRERIPVGDAGRGGQRTES